MHTVSQRARSEIMSQVRGKNTAPEIVVRCLGHRMGYQFRLHRRDIPAFISLRNIRGISAASDSDDHLAEGVAST